MRETLTFLVLLPTLAVLAEGPAAGTEILKIGSISWEEEARRVHVQGTADLPWQAVVIGTLLREAQPARYARAEVGADGEFALAFDLDESTLFPGKYVVRVEVRADDQPTEVVETLAGTAVPPASSPFDVGSPEEQEAFLRTARTRLLEILRSLGQLYQGLTQEASFTIATVGVLKRRSDGKLPARDQARLLRDFDRYGAEFWEMRLRSSSHDWRDYREQVVGGVYPEVEQDIEEIQVLLWKWYVSYWKEVAEELGASPPERIFVSEAFPRDELEPEIDGTVARAYGALGMHDPIELAVWKLVRLAAPERGKVVGNTYESYSAKFRIARPNDAWAFDFSVNSQTVRCRILPKDRELQKRDKIAIVVEIRDFPEAKGRADLDRILEVYHEQRWRGYRRISGKPLSHPDPTMPDGTRPGYEIVCLIAGEGNSQYRVRIYELYCRWLKRTYAVVCIAESARFADHANEFDAAVRSFEVLDDPRVIEKAREEEAGVSSHVKGGKTR